MGSKHGYGYRTHGGGFDYRTSDRWCYCFDTSMALDLPVQVSLTSIDNLGEIRVRRKAYQCFSIPIGATSFLTLFFTFPTRLPNEPCATNPAFTFRSVFSLESLSRIDGLGLTLLLRFCVLLVTGLEQAALGYSWTSGIVLTLLLCGLAFFLSFFTWSWYVTSRRTSPEPVFPWRFLQSRIRVAMLL
jgi:hypothetical protein